MRLLAIVLALGTALGHLILSVANPIPGEQTAGPLFATMGVGYLVVAGLITRRVVLLDELASLYTVGLILAYAASRLPIDGALPVEPIGLVIKVDEAVLLLLLLREIRNARPRALK